MDFGYRKSIGTLTSKNGETSKGNKMENNFSVEYVRVSRENPNSCTDFMNLGYEYMKEVAPDKDLEESYMVS